MTGGGSFGLHTVVSVDPTRWKGTPRVLGPRWTHLPTLTIGLLGVQIFWSVEMSYASPYLLSLGLTQSHVALVFLAGPLSGLLVQPLVGALADTSTSSWGRRRPYMLAGCAICVAGMLLLGYTRAVAAIFTTRGSRSHDALTVVLAVLSIFVIDFSINAVQAVDRALLVDTLPPAAQPAGNACAALMLGIGSVVGFFVGNLPLPTLLPFLQADSELQALAVLVSALLLGCHVLTAACVRERVLLKGPGCVSPLSRVLLFVSLPAPLRPSRCSSLPSNALPSCTSYPLPSSSQSTLPRLQPNANPHTPSTPRPSLARELRDIWTHMRTLPHVIR
ncbi:hypothetical protein B0H10DRAFT_1878615, partial [Mycena sp. CBHHK59/15]